MRVRFLKAVNGRLGFFKPGDVAELEDEKARSLIGFGIAEQDKMIDAAPETKPAGAVYARAFAHRGNQVHTGPQNATLEVFQGTAKQPVPPPGVIPPAEPEAPAPKPARKKR